MPRLSETAASTIESRVRELESKTSLEIVPVVTPKSADYVRERMIVALVLTLAFVVAAKGWLWGWPIWADAILAVVMALVLYGFVSIPIVFRLVIPAPWLRAAVEEGAEDAFVRHEVFATRGRSGVLLYISWLEHAVLVVADKGVLARVPVERWQELGQRLAADLAKSGSERVFLSALDEFEREIVPLFPPTPENPNELPNQLRRD